MPAIDFEERDMEASVPDLAAGGAWTRTQLRWRRDPLTGASARILTGVKLQPTTRPDLGELTAPPAFCPFDADRLETATFPFPKESRARAAYAADRRWWSPMSWRTPRTAPWGCMTASGTSWTSTSSALA